MSDLKEIRLVLAQIAGIMPDLIRMVELGIERLDQLERQRESGRRGGARSGETRRAKGASLPVDNPVENGKRSTLRSKTRRVLRHVENDSGIPTKGASIPEVTAPIYIQVDHVDHDSGDRESEDQQGTKTEERDVAKHPSRGTRSTLRREPVPVPHQAETIDIFHQVYKRTYGAKPTWDGKSVSMVRGLLKKHKPDEIARRIHILFESPPSWLSPPFDLGTLVRFFDKLVIPATAPALRRELTPFERQMERIKMLEAEAAAGPGPGFHAKGSGFAQDERSDPPEGISADDLPPWEDEQP